MSARKRLLLYAELLREAATYLEVQARHPTDHDLEWYSCHAIYQAIAAHVGLSVNQVFYWDRKGLCSEHQKLHRKGNKLKNGIFKGLKRMGLQTGSMTAFKSYETDKHQTRAQSQAMRFSWLHFAADIAEEQAHANQ